jgi:hypothetical protein
MQNTKQKDKDLSTRTLLKTGHERRCIEGVTRSSSTLAPVRIVIYFYSFRWQVILIIAEVYLRFYVGSYYSIFSFMCNIFCRWLFVLLYFFLLTTVLSVLLWFMDSYCSFGIFKLFLQYIAITIYLSVPIYLNCSGLMRQSLISYSIQFYGCQV